MPEPVAAYQGRERDAALRTLLCVGERRRPEAGRGGIRALLEDLREAENARLGAGAVGLERLRVGQQVRKPLADRPGHLDRHLPRPGRELAGDRPQHLLPGAPLPVFSARLHSGSIARQPYRGRPAGDCAECDKRLDAIRLGDERPGQPTHSPNGARRSCARQNESTPA